MKTNALRRPLVLSAAVVIISLNRFITSNHPPVRTVDLITLLAAGVGIGVFLSTLIHWLILRKKSQNPFEQG